MARVVSVVLNNATRDPRVLKQAATLAKAGHSVTIVGIMDRTVRTADETLASGVRIVRVDIAARQSSIRRSQGVFKATLELVATGLLFAALLLPVELGFHLVVGALVALLLCRVVGRLAQAGRRSHIGSWLWGVFRTRVRRLAIYAARVGLPVPSPEVARARALFALVRSLDPEVVHCHDIHTLPVGALVKVELAGCSVIYDAHEIYEELAQGDHLTASRYRRMHRRYLRCVDRFVTINDSIAAWYAAHYPELPPAVVVMNATNDAGHVSYDGRLHVAAGLQPDVRIMLYQGGFAARRGLEYFVRSAAFLPACWVAVLMGWGRLEEQLRSIADGINAAAEASGRPARVRFVLPAPQSELHLWTAGATVGVIPYESAGLNHWYCTPNKLWEYPNAGVPVLVSPFPELRKPVEAYGYGWLLPEVQDPCALAAQVAALSEIEMARARAACRSFIAAESWTKYAEVIVSLYEELLGSVVSSSPPRVHSKVLAGPVGRSQVSVNE